MKQKEILHYAGATAFDTIFSLKSNDCDKEDCNNNN